MPVWFFYIKKRHLAKARKIDRSVLTDAGVSRERVSNPKLRFTLGRHPMR